MISQQISQILQNLFLRAILKMTKKYDKSAEFKNNNDGNDADNDEL